MRTSPWRRSGEDGLGVRRAEPWRQLPSLGPSAPQRHEARHPHLLWANASARPAPPRPATALTFPTRPETHGARVRPPPPPLEVPPASASLTDPSSACPPRPPLLLEAPSRPPQPRAAALSPPPCDPGCAQRGPCPPAGASEPGSAPAEALALSGGPLASLPRSAGLGGPPSGVAGVVITLGFTWRKLPAHTSAVLRTVLITVKAGFITL